MLKLVTSSMSELLRRVELGRPLADLTTFRIGGPAEAFFAPRNEKDLQAILEVCRIDEMPVRVIGGGSNLLINDFGINGMVLNLSAMREVHAVGNRIRVEAGMPLSRLIAWTTTRGLGGLEKLAGIPGNIGGAIAMNAGGRYAEIGDFVEEVRLISPSEGPQVLSARDISFGYRSTNLGDAVITGVTLRLEEGDARTLTTEAKRITREKTAVQPYDAKSAGCIFRNPEGSEHGAGKLIDLAKLKGMRIGDARISEKHGNFIENIGSAKARHVDELIAFAQSRVFENFGITLETEVKRWAASEPVVWRQVTQRA